MKQLTLPSPKFENVPLKLLYLHIISCLFYLCKRRSVKMQFNGWVCNTLASQRLALASYLAIGQTCKWYQLSSNFEKENNHITQNVKGIIHPKTTHPYFGQSKTALPHSSEQLKQMWTQNNIKSLHKACSASSTFEKTLLTPFYKCESSLQLPS